MTSPRAPTVERAAEVDVLLACSALAGAAARLATMLHGTSVTWRDNGRRLTIAAASLVNDMNALRVVRSATLRRQQASRMAQSADDATALAMRLHNLLPSAVAASAAFDVAACAAAVAAAIRALVPRPI